MSAAFSGDSITWVYEKNASCGIANVTIDGVSKGTVDQYSSSPVFQATTTWSGLGAGNHTIVVTNSKTRDSGLEQHIHHPRRVPGQRHKRSLSDPTPVLENNYDGETTYQWGKITNAAASGGNYSADVSTRRGGGHRVQRQRPSRSSTPRTPHAESLTSISTGSFQGQVDQYSASPVYQASTTYSGLANTLTSARHELEELGTPRPSNTFMTVDAFVVGSDLVAELGGRG